MGITTYSNQVDIWNRFIEETYPSVRRFEFNEIPAESDYFVMLIEPRPHPHLEYVLRNVMYFLGSGWGLQIFTGMQNMQYIQEIVKDWNTVYVYQLARDDLSIYEYNQIRKDPNFWKVVKGEYVLCVETDSLLCSGNIREFLSYDYIGAPWVSSLALSPKCLVGNGGLSLRRRRAMIEIGSVCNRDYSFFRADDIFYSINMHLYHEKYNLPSVDVAKRFSVEAIYYPKPFGVHKAWRYLPEHQLRAILNNIRYEN